MTRTQTTPRISSPVVQNADVDMRQQIVTVTYITTYEWTDTSRYTHVEHDYALRWKLSVDRDLAQGSVEVWSRRHQQWHEVWSTRAEVLSAYSPRTEDKAMDWQRVFDQLADKAGVVLLRIAS